MSAHDDEAPAVPPARKMAEALAPLHERAGLDAPELTARDAPLVYLGLPDDELASRVADLLHAPDGRWGLFLRAGEVVYIEDGQFKPMSSRTFRTWLPSVRGAYPWARKKRVTTESGDQEEKLVKGSLSQDQAGIILESVVLRTKLPVIRGINDVMLPVFSEREKDARGLPKLRLLQPGFDPETGTWTRHGLEYPLDMSLLDAMDNLLGLFQHFGWRRLERDFSIHLAALLTCYGRGLYSGKAPGFVYNANMQGSGKTTLAWIGPWAVYGARDTKPLRPDAEQKLEELLNSEARAGTPFLIFDNIDWGSKPVQTVLLDGWLSNVTHSFRLLGGNEMASCDLQGVVTFFTGNNMKLSPDLARRTLMVDLVNHVAAGERVLPPGATRIDSRWFADLENRRQILGALWALVRQWDEDGRPMNTPKPLDSFELWSEVVPSIVRHAGEKISNLKRVWSLDCLAVSENAEVGDKETREFRQLAELAMAEFGRDEEGQVRECYEITVQQLAGVARRNMVATRSLYPEMDIESVLDTEGRPGGWRFRKTGDESKFFDPDAEAAAEGNHEERMRQAAEYLTPKTRSSFGNAVKGKLHEKHFRGPDGLMYEWTHRMKVTPASYLVARVKGVR